VINHIFKIIQRHTIEISIDDEGFFYFKEDLSVKEERKHSIKNADLLDFA